MSTARSCGGRQFDTTYQYVKDRTHIHERSVVGGVMDDDTSSNRIVACEEAVDAECRLRP
jgi:hypothetical protein